MTASLVKAVGHPEWVAENAREYVAIGEQLAANLDELSELRRRLRQEVAGSVLLDHAGQAARFGAAIRACWRDWCVRVGPVA